MIPIKLKGMLFLLLQFFLLSCDFTPQLHKEILLAQKDISLEKYSEAVSRYEKILLSNPPKDIKVKIFYQLGEFYSIQFADYKNALKYYKKVKEISEDSFWTVRAEQKIGEINFIYTKDYTSAVENYSRLFGFSPKLDKVDFYQYRLGVSFFKIGKMDKSFEIFDTIRKNKTHQFHVKSFYHLGMICFQQKKWQKAISYWQDYEKIETRRDNVVQARFLMANAYETMEKLKKAYNLYYSILGEYPHTEVLKNRLNSIYTRKVARKR